jgi:hypothetical protein
MRIKIDKHRVQLKEMNISVCRTMLEHNHHDSALNARGIHKRREMIARDDIIAPSQYIAHLAELKSSDDISNSLQVSQ